MNREGTMKYPLLTAMRARRRQQEDELSAPHVAAAFRAKQEAAAEREARRGLERIMASAVAKEVTARMGHELSGAAKHQVLEAVAKSEPKGGVVTLKFSADELRWLDPDSMQRRVLERWQHEVMPRARFEAVPSLEAMQDSFTVLEVRVPELRYRQAIDSRHI